MSLDTLREAFNAQVTGYRDGPCRYLHLKPATLESKDGHLHLAIPGRGALGVPLAGACQTAATWQGIMHFTLAPRIDEAGRVRVQVVDSRASGIAPAMWEMGKKHLHERLQGFRYDLRASRESLAGLLRGTAPPVQAAAMEQALQQLEVLKPQVEATHVVIPIALRIPDAWLAAAPAAASGAPLTEAELEALDKAFEPWDAFLITIVRQIAIDGEDAALRQRLFTLLLDSRYRLSALLAGDEPVQGDPLRALFLETWSELRTILLDAQRAGTLAPSLLRYTLFVDAADALAAVETAAPGLALSADGLRQLARSLKPGESDPLAYDWSVDSELGRLFEAEEIPSAEPAPAPPPARSWLDFFVSRAYADNPLDRWVPTRQELASYEARVGDLLQKTAASELQRGAAGGALRSRVPAPGSDHCADRKLLAAIRGAQRQGDLPALAVEQRRHHADQPARVARLLRHRARALGHRVQHARRRADPDALPEGLRGSLRAEDRQARGRGARRVRRLQRRTESGQPVRQEAAASARSARGREAVDALPRHRRRRGCRPCELRDR